MNTLSLSRIFTGTAVLVFSVWFIISVGLGEGAKVDWVALIGGLFFAAVGVFIIFNKEEDNIEKINDE